MAATDLVDALRPPDFEPNGSIKTIDEVIADGDWFGGIHMWLYMRHPVPSVVCQLRAPNARIAPNKLDVSAAGHYDTGEQGLDGTRELQEELGLTVPHDAFEYWGKRLFITQDTSQRICKYALNVYTAEHQVTLKDMNPQPGEVSGVFIVPLAPLLEVLVGKRAVFIVQGKSDTGHPLSYTIRPDAFHPNPDNYHLHLLEHIAFKLGVTL